MISVEDCEFIKKFEVANSEEKQIILTSEGHQVSSLNNFFSLYWLSVHAGFTDCFGTPTKWKQAHWSMCTIFLSVSCCNHIFFWLFFFFSVLVCKDLPEPNGSHLQRANSPVHPDFDWWHSAGRDKSTVCCQIILMFTLKWKYWNHSLTITIIQANGKRKTMHLAIVIRLLFGLLLAC